MENVIEYLYVHYSILYSLEKSISWQSGVCIQVVHVGPRFIGPEIGLSKLHSFVSAISACKCLQLRSMCFIVHEQENMEELRRTQL